MSEWHAGQVTVTSHSLRMASRGTGLSSRGLFGLHSILGLSPSQELSLSHLPECGFPPQWNLPLLHFPRRPLKGESCQKVSRYTCLPDSMCHWVNFSSPSGCSIQRDSTGAGCMLPEPGCSWLSPEVSFVSAFAVVCFQVILGPLQSRVQGPDPGSLLRLLQTFRLRAFSITE